MYGYRISSNMSFCQCMHIMYTSIQPPFLVPPTTIPGCIGIHSRFLFCHTVISCQLLLLFYHVKRVSLLGFFICLSVCPSVRLSTERERERETERETEREREKERERERKKERARERERQRETRSSNFQLLLLPWSVLLHPRQMRLG